MVRHHPRLIWLLGAVAAVGVAFGWVAPVHAQNGSVSGVVTAHGGTPLANISVTAFVQSDDGTGGVIWSVAAMTQTEATGVYTLAGLNAGVYALQFDEFGFPPAHLSELYNDKAIDDIALADLITVTSSSVITAINAELAEGAHITGVVSDIDSVGIANVWVRPYRLVSGQWVETIGATTDASGAYELLGLSAGSYRLCFEPDPAIFPALHAVTCYLHNRNLEQAQAIPVAQSQRVTDINVTLDRTGEIHGQVTDALGAPVQGIGIGVLRLVQDAVNGDQWILTTFADTDQNGDYVVLGLEPNRYRLSFGDNAFPRRYSSEYYANADSLSLADDVVVGAGAVVTGIDAQLEDLGALGGRVTDSTGSAVTQVMADLYMDVNYPNHGPPAWSLNASVAVGADGSYQFEQLEASAYLVGFRSVSLPLPEYVDGFYAGQPTLEAATVVTLTRGQARLDINQELVAYGRAAGRVTDVAGQPLADLIVTLYRPDSASASGWSPAAHTVTDADGRYEFRGLANGPYRVGFNTVDDVRTSSPALWEAHRGDLQLFVPEYYDNAPALTAAGDITVGLNVRIDNVDAQLTALARITGKVTDLGGNPIAAWNVNAYRSPITGTASIIASTTTAADGRYALLGLEPGAYRVQFGDAQPFARYHGEFYDDAATLEAGNDIVLAANQVISNINAALRPAGVISGVVTDGQGAPIQSIAVLLYRFVGPQWNTPTQWALVRSDFTAVDGHYSLGGLDDDTYRIAFQDSLSPPRYQREFYVNADYVDGAANLVVDPDHGTLVVDAVLDAFGARSTPPLARPDAINVLEGGSASQLTVGEISLLWNDEDAEFQPLTGRVVTSPTHGTLLMDDLGHFVYSHDGSEASSDFFTYAAFEGIQSSPATTVTVAISGINDAPLAVADAISVARRGTAVQLSNGADSVLVNDLDPEGDALTATLVLAPQHGRLTLDATGSFSYTHDGSATTSDLFTYQVSDGLETSNPVTVTITMINRDPVAVADAMTVNRRGVVTQLRSGATSLLANDRDADQDPLSAVLVQSPQHGSLTLDVAGGFSYTHDGSATTSDLFTYQVSDGLATSNPVTVTIKIVNRRPAAVADALTVNRGGAVTQVNGGATTVLANDSDPDQDLLNAVLIQAPQHGALVLNADGAFSYHHDGSATASDSFIYNVSDGLATSTAVTVKITIVNGIPVAVPDAMMVNRRGIVTQLTGGAQSLRANDSDPDQDPLSVTLVQAPQHGAFVLNADGAFRYQHDGSATTSDSFTYRVSDGMAASSPVTVAIAIVNRLPVAVEDAMTVNRRGVVTQLNGGGVSMLSNDSDPDQDPLTALIVQRPQHGALVLNADGAFRYQHDGSASTSDLFTYRVGDGLAASAPVTVTITIINRGPAAAADALSVNRRGVVTELIGGATSLVANDSDPDQDPLSAVLVQGPQHGVLQLSASGAFSYQHDGGGAASDQFSYRVSDGLATSNPVTVTITIVNHSPTAAGDALTVNRRGVVTQVNGGATSLLSNDSDADQDPLSAVLVQGPQHGVLQLSENGAFSYQHDGGSAASDAFTYRISDGLLTSNLVTATITIINRSPVGAADSISVFRRGTAVKLEGGADSVAANDNDQDGDPLKVILLQAPKHGVLKLSASGVFSYVHDGGVATSDFFVYMVNDGLVSSAGVKVMITIVNRTPASGADSITLLRGASATQLNSGSTSVLANDSDEDGDPISTLLVRGPEHGLLTLRADGTFVYTNTASTPSPDSFVYSAQDGVVAGPPTTVTILVRPRLGLRLQKTVGAAATSPLCPSTSDIRVPLVSQVVYCFVLINTGDAPLTAHSLTDEHLGNLLDGAKFELMAGQRHMILITATVTLDVTSLATWSATAVDPTAAQVGETAATLQSQATTHVALSGEGDDQDGDGITDYQEGSDDGDHDNLPNFLDSDSDGDTIPDRVEGTDDTDFDNIMNFLDMDSDNDSLPDAMEAGCTTATPADQDDNGIADYLEFTLPSDHVTEICLYLPVIQQ